MIEFFLVGGFVRDKIMGVSCKDVDFTCVAPSFKAMRQSVLDHGMKIVVDTPEFFTVRAVAKTPFMGHTGGLDFVWARKDGAYSDGRRPDSVTPGTLLDDLARRDFTINAMAKAADGSIVDPFNGRQDIRRGVLRCVGDPDTRFQEDSLRILRALRFSVTKTMIISTDTQDAMTRQSALIINSSKERQREEVEKMFAFDTLRSMQAFAQFPMLSRLVFDSRLRLSATMKK